MCHIHVLKYQTQHKWPAEREIGQDYLTWLTPRVTGTVLPAYGRCSRATCTAKRHATCFMTSHALTLSLSFSVHPSCSVTLSVPGFGSTVLTIIPVCTCDCSAEENWVREAMPECEAAEKKVSCKVHLCAKSLSTYHTEVKWFWALGQTGPNKLVKEDRQGLAKYKSTITISSSLPIGTSK